MVRVAGRFLGLIAVPAGVAVLAEENFDSIFRNIERGKQLANDVANAVC